MSEPTPEKIVSLVECGMKAIKAGVSPSESQLAAAKVCEFGCKFAEAYRRLSEDEQISAWAFLSEIVLAKNLSEAPWLVAFTKIRNGK